MSLSITFAERCSLSGSTTLSPASFSTVCVQLNRESCLQLLLCPGVDGFLDVLQVDRVETNNAAIEGLVELEILLLRAFQVHNAEHVFVRLEVFMGGVLFVRVFCPSG